MRSIPIASIELDGSDRLLVRPLRGSDVGFEYIYRSATGVRWRAEDGAFYPVEVGDLSSALWFAEIVAAARAELGVDLRFSPDTSWVTVPDRIRHEIESLVSREPV
jgi:hypothetical protein